MNAATFQSGKSWSAYIKSISKNRNKFEPGYNSFEPSAGDLDFFGAFKPLNIAAIGEDWCPDVFNTLGTVAKIADALPNAELRIFERDSREDLMHDYLSDGKKRIPVYAFFDGDFKELCRFCGRVKEADDWVNAFRRGRPYDQIPKDELETFRAELNERYRTQYSRANLEEIKNLLRH